MKRKLISFDAFESIQNNSLSTAERELVEASPLLSKALNVENLELLSYGQESALFEAADGTYVHGHYKIDKGVLTLEGIEQLAIDNDSENAKRREAAGLLLDSLLNNKDEEAKQHFESYVNLPVTRRIFREGFAEMIEKKKAEKGKKKAKCAIPKKDKKKGLKKFGKGPKDGKGFAKKAGKKLKEWASLCENVYDYCDYQEYGPSLKECIVEHDAQHEATKVSMPVTFGRNSMKLLSFNWKTLDANYKLARTTAKLTSENTEFCKAIADLKRHNALADSNALEEALENIVSTFPTVLFLTEAELASQIKKALETVRASNYDDQTCAFMAEGILRTAHNAFADKVSKITTLSGNNVNEESTDKYADFRELVNAFYPTLDESAAREMQMYVDLYEALKSVYDIAQNEGDEYLRSETASHLNELVAIVQQQVSPDPEIAENAADWLNFLSESGLMAWNVSNKAGYTVSGDVPRMAELGRTSPIMPGQYGDPAPSSDGKNVNKANADKMRDSAWGNVAGPGTWPSLTNPYVPQPFGDYTMKGEPGVDKNASTGMDMFNSKDTWPNLTNPYVPKEPSVDRMKSDDLIVDK